jgi:hypothetical protein
MIVLITFSTRFRSAWAAAATCSGCHSTEVSHLCEEGCSDGLAHLGEVESSIGSGSRELLRRRLPGGLQPVCVDELVRKHEYGIALAPHREGSQPLETHALITLQLTRDYLPNVVPDPQHILLSTGREGGA